MSSLGEYVDTVLVPLDGSELAERAIPLAERLAAATGCQLQLVSVLSPPRWHSASSGYLFHSKQYAAALAQQEGILRARLETRAERVRTHRIRVDVRVVRAASDPASTLIGLATAPSVGLVVMASHGRTGVERWALGSVAEQLISQASVPVAVVRPFGADADGVNMAHAVVPLDGSALAELALPFVARLAGTLLTEVTLARVVDPDLLSGETDEAARYLEEVRNRFLALLGERSCKVNTTILYGSVAEQIIERAQATKGLTIMTTHGRTGVAGWPFGHVAEHLLRHAHCPLIVLPSHMTT